MSNRFLKFTLSPLLLILLTGCPDSERLQCPGTYTLSDALDSQKRFGSSVCPKVALMNAHVEFRSASNTDLNHIFGDNHPPSGSWRESIDVVFEYTRPEVVLFDPSQSKLLCFNGECNSRKLPNPLPPLMGAYNFDSEKIYLSSDLFIQDDNGNQLNDFLDTSSTAALGVAVQELAHHYDRNFSRSANHGSEGAIASFLLVDSRQDFTPYKLDQMLKLLKLREDDARIRLRLLDGSSITMNAELGWSTWKIVLVTAVATAVIIFGAEAAAVYFVGPSAITASIEGGAEWVKDGTGIWNWIFPAD